MFLKLKKYIPSAIWFHVLQLETKEFLKEHKVIFIFFFYFEIRCFTRWYFW